MTLLGIDIGTTGCKAAVFSAQGRLLCSAYEEYDMKAPRQGWAVLDSSEVWEKIKLTIRKSVSSADSDPVKALSVSSLGEAVVPVTKERQIIGDSILFFDPRGQEYVERLKSQIDDKNLYQINGNKWNNQHTATKLMWVKDNQPQLYDKADKFLLWGSFVGFMLGGEPCVDLSLANRTLLFDIEKCNWSDQLLSVIEIDASKLPEVVESGTVTGRISPDMAEELGLDKDVVIVAGAHDQCANALGCGSIEPGQAMYGMGTFLCATPVYGSRPSSEEMIRIGLNTEHHVLKDKYVSFIYNQGGCLVKWFRDTFAREDCNLAKQNNEDIYNKLFSELEDKPSSVVVLPYFSATGPPDFLTDSSGLIGGLKLDTSRDEILKGIVEGTAYYLLESINNLSKTGFEINEYRAVGGGSKSDLWLQLTADILKKPLTRLKINEAGTLGAAIIAGKGAGLFSSLPEGVKEMVNTERVFEPDQKQSELYSRNYQKYLEFKDMAKLNNALS